MVTTTNGKDNAIVWWIGAEGDSYLRGMDGDTGTVVFGGGNDAISNVRRFQTPIAAKGRIFAASDNAVVAFTTN
jgi:hypothetical protein